MLGLPYVFAPFGIVTTSIFLVALGFVMLVLNLMIGEVAFALKKPLQLPGIAREVLGRGVQQVLSLVIIFSWLGSLLAYIVGEGEVLAALFGGSGVLWSYAFWFIASFFLLLGFKVVVRISHVISFLAIVLLVGISLYALSYHTPQVTLPFSSLRLSAVFGVALFALHGAPAIAEAHELLKNNRQKFRRALILGTLIPVAVYILFTVAVVGVTGLASTPVATVGLGLHIGGHVATLGALCALCAMLSCYLGIGTALRETLNWDNRLIPLVSLLITILAPIGLFASGVRNFSRIMVVVGGVFIAFEAVVMIFVYVYAVKKRIIVSKNFYARHPWLTGIPTALVFVAGAIASLISR